MLICFVQYDLTDTFRTSILCIYIIQGSYKVLTKVLYILIIDLSVGPVPCGG